MHKISAVVITFNEELKLKRCLDSLQSVSDEIVVVDSFSTDSTPDICREYQTVRFFSNRFDGYGAQKNYGISKAENDLILSLDADEALSGELVHSILVLKNCTTICDVFIINRLNNYCGKWIRHGGWYPDKKLRLWNRTVGVWDLEPVHEKVVFKKNASVGTLIGDIQHFSYSTISEHINQMNKFTDLSAIQMKQKGKKSSLCGAIFRASWKFIHDYFLKRGFLDGRYGFIISVVSSFTTFVKYAKTINLFSIADRKNHEKSER